MDNLLVPPPSLVAPAPWHLTGKGLIFLYHFPKTFNQQFGFLDEYQQQGYRGGIGAVILASYKTSGVGAYQELMYLPGLVEVGGKLGFSISKIYVSTYSSVWNGRENWGIPKEKADFSVLQSADGSLTYQVRSAENTFFSARVKPWGPKLPVTTALLPLTRLVQQLRHQFRWTNIQATGAVQLASAIAVSAQGSFFPPVQQLKPLLVLSVPNFRMTFPVARVLPVRGREA